MSVPETRSSAADVAGRTRETGFPVTCLPDPPDRGSKPDLKRSRCGRRTRSRVLSEQQLL